MPVCGVSEQLYVEHRERRVGYGLAENGFCIRLKSSVEFFLRAVGGNEREIDPHLPHRYGEEIVCPAVYGRACYHVIAAVGYIENSVEIGSLSRRGEHGGCPALELAYLLCHLIVRRILKSRIEIPRSLKVEKLTHILACIVLEGSALIYGQLPGFTVSGDISSLDALGLDLHLISYLSISSSAI